MRKIEILKQKIKDRKNEYLNHVKKEILEQIKNAKENEKRFTEDDLPERMNSYEWNLYLPLLSNNDLIINTEYCILNSLGEFKESDKYDIESVRTYNEVLKHKIIHLLIERLKESL